MQHQNLFQVPWEIVSTLDSVRWGIWREYVSDQTRFYKTSWRQNFASYISIKERFDLQFLLAEVQDACGFFVLNAPIFEWLESTIELMIHGPISPDLSFDRQEYDTGSQIVLPKTTDCISVGDIHLDFEWGITIRQYIPQSCPSTSLERTCT